MLDLVVLLMGELALLAVPFVARRWPRPVAWLFGAFAGGIIAGGLVWLLPPPLQEVRLYRQAYPGEPVAYVYGVWLAMAGVCALAGAGVAYWIVSEPATGSFSDLVAFRGVLTPGLVFARRSRALLLAPYAALVITAMAIAESQLGRTPLDRDVGVDVAVGAGVVFLLSCLYLWQLPRVALTYPALVISTHVGATSIPWASIRGVRDTHVRGVRHMVVQLAAPAEVDGPAWLAALSRADQRTSRDIVLPLALWRGGGELFRRVQACAISESTRQSLFGGNALPLATAPLTTSDGSRTPR